MLEIDRVPVEEILPLREAYRREMGCQIVHDSFAERGYSEPYLLRVEGRAAGYGLVARKHYPDTVHEFHLLPAFRAEALPLFRRLLEVSRAARIRTQTNDRHLLLLLYDCAAEIAPDTLLFEDAYLTRLPCPGGRLRPAGEGDGPRLSAAGLDPDAGWMIECGGVPVAAGGVLFHYNPPYGDLYMEVREDCRRRGYGGYLVQELKRICREKGRTPAARCSPANTASRRTLQRAGLLPCARILEGVVAR